MWPINSEIYFLTITRALYLPWEMWTLWSQKCNYFTYHCSKKNDRKRIQAFFVWLSNSVICWKSTQFAENWRWHYSLDRVGRGWEFQQITELWIRVIYLHAKCQKRLSVIRKSEEELRKHHLHFCGSLKIEGYISKFRLKMLTLEVKLYTSCNNKANFSVEISEVFLLISTHETKLLHLPALKMAL